MPSSPHFTREEVEGQMKETRRKNERGPERMHFSREDDRWRRRNPDLA